MHVVNWSARTALSTPHRERPSLQESRLGFCGSALVHRRRARVVVRGITLLKATGARAELGVVIVDHGSRRAASNDMLKEFVVLYQSVTGRNIVEPAHMEIAEPTIEQAIGHCVSQGAHDVVVAPYFLSKGRHIQDDIPALVREAQLKYPQVNCTVAEPVGVDTLMAQIIENRVLQAENITGALG